MLNFILLYLNPINYYKRFGKNLYFIYGGNDSKLYNIKKSLKEKLYKIGSVSSGIFYYKDSFQNMMSIYFRITGVLLIFNLIFLFIFLPNLYFLYDSIFFLSFKFFEFISLKKNVFNDYDFFIFCDFYLDFFFVKFLYFFEMFNLTYDFNHLSFFLFKFFIVLFIFSFIYHILEKFFIYIKYTFFYDKKASGYYHFLVKNKKI